MFVANKILVTFDTDVEHAALLMVFLFMSKIKKRNWSKYPSQILMKTNKKTLEGCVVCWNFVNCLLNLQKHIVKIQWSVHLTQLV